MGTFGRISFFFIHWKLPFVCQSFKVSLKNASWDSEEVTSNKTVLLTEQTGF